MNIHYYTYFFYYLVLIVVRNIAESFVKPAIKEDPSLKIEGRRSLLLFILCYMVSAVAVGFLLMTIKTIRSYTFFPGLALMIISYAGRILTLRRMGGIYSQSITPLPNAQLITSGIFSVIRHPLYTFYTLELASFVLVYFNYISLVCLIVTIFVTVHRVKREEVFLWERFGEKFLDYGKRTRKYIPYIY